MMQVAKRQMCWMFAVSMLFVGGGCKKKAAGGGPAAAAVALAPLDLGSAGIKATLQAPAGAKAKESFGQAVVTAGTSFGMEVSKGPTDLARRRKALSANQINKLKKIHVDAADALLYESEVMRRTEFHFVANVRGFSCEDVKGRPWTRAAAELMLRSCRTLKAKP